MAETDRIEKKHKKAKAKEAAVQQKDEASISFYLHASLFLFFLTSYTFLLFLYENKYPLILNNEILPEVLFACFGLLIFSFLSLFILSFWRFLARVFIAAVAGGAAAYILGLLYPFNIGNYFAHYFSFLPQNVLLYIAENGNQIIAILAGIAFFIMLNVFKGGAMAFLSLPVLVALFMLLNTAAKQTIPETVRTTAAADNKAEKDNTENLIYLILADHTGYATAVESWQLLNSKSLNPVALPFNPTFIPSFYQTNKFTFYPSAYLRYQDKYRNIGNVLNPSLTEVGNDLFNRDDAAYYVSSEDAQVYITRNDLFKELKKQGYRLNVYQTYPFDFCKGAGVKDVDFCQTYPAPLGALYQTNMTTASRLMLLVGHWLYSTPFGKGAAEFIYEKLKNTVNLSNVPFLGNPLSMSLPVGQPLVLSGLRHDVLAAKGKNAFFAHLNLPHYPYVYDQNCQLKADPMAWRSNTPYTDKKELNGELKRWEDYNRQLFCTYGQINYLIKELENAKLLDKTTIVIHGDKGANIQKEKTDDLELTRVDKAINRFKNNMTTVFGIYKPQNKTAEINKVPCDIGTLIANQLLGNSSAVCQPPDWSRFTQEEQEKSLAWLGSAIADNYFPAASFEPLYSSWLEKGGQAYMAALDERLKQTRKTQTETSKLSFVAPPAFLEADQEKQPEKSKQTKEKTTDFVPVPEKKPLKTEVPASLEKTAEEQNEPAKSPAPAGTETTAQEEQPSAGTEQPDGEQTDSPAALENRTEDIIADDFGELPKPIVLPEIDSSVEEKWKTTDIKEGQKTTLELLPDLAETEEKTTAKDAPVPAEMPVREQELPSPQPAPAPAVEILPLPALEPEKIPAETKTDLPKAELPPLEVLEVPELTPLPAAETDVPAPATNIEIKPLEMLEVPELTPLPAAETDVPAPAETEQAEAEIKAKAEAEAKTKADAEAKAEAEAKAKAEAEAKAKAEAEAKTKAEAEAKAKADAEAKAKADAEAKAKAETEAKAKAEAEAKAKAETEAKAKADAEAKAKAEAEAKAKAETEAKAKAEAEAKAKAKAEAEEIRKKAPPPPANADQLDIIKETVTEQVNEDGEIETYIFIERKPNPNRFKKKEAPQRELQQDLLRVPSSAAKPEPAAAVSAPKPAAVPQENQLDDNDLIRAPAPVSAAPAGQNSGGSTKTSVPAAVSPVSAPVERVLED